ncbi:hypothetical protein FM104_13505 [Microbacterium esteraromaticum]|uniref:Uncharacterized protein n=1 Tax=Microbacterium esteraromaticum TaxID=57043 RepID=A0A1R4KKV4_9MICO|nr:hypothetical protein [Microbacterium esteraromaticum]SJN44664.1 hypothetical protein FM104_13505 [Microbacterium esteraromaticum]
MSTHHDPSDKPDSSPVSIPLAIITVGEIGAVIATLDGVGFAPPAPAETWSRAQFGELLDTLTLGRKRTVRIEVRESDGTVFTDIIHAKRLKHGDQEADLMPPTGPHSRRERRRTPPLLLDISGSGFIPGEDITVAIPVTSAEGNATGDARAVVDLSRLLDHATEVMLIGHISGRIVTERLP